MAINSILIKNGTIFEGTKDKPRYQADVAIRGEKINEIGDMREENADLVIDASNLYVAPGFIDLTTHSDTHWTLFSQPIQESFIRQGVTTILGGHGGYSLAPILKPEVIGALGKWMDISKISLNWQSIDEFFNEIEKHRLGINFAMLVGQETLRENILEGTEPPDKKELKSMCQLLEESLKQGVFGLSTNLENQLGRTTLNEEMNDLLEVIRKSDGVSMHHLEDEGKNLLPAISRVIMFLRNSNSRGHIAHFKALGRTAWENFGNALNMIELAQKDGISITCDFFPYTRTGSNLVSLLPSWILTEDKEKILSLMKDKRIRQDLIEYLKSLTLHYEKMVIASSLRDTGCAGKTVKELMELSELSGEEIIIDILQINELQVSIFNEVISTANLEILAQKPYIAVSSDGVGYEIKEIKNKKDLAHPRSFGSFPKFFSEFVKDKSLISWEEAVYKMTGLPAKILGLKRRGVLQEGNYADITIFDPSRIRDKTTYDNPFQYSEGAEYVIINGNPVLKKDDLIEGGGVGKIIKKE